MLARVNSKTVCHTYTMQRRVSDLLVQLFVHQQVCLGPASEEPHNVFSHLRAQQLRQAGSGRPGLNL